MAGDWIKMRADLLTHPKVVRIVSALKADKLRVIGGLHAVWSLFDAHSADGTLDGYTAEALDDYIGWPGFCAAMVLVGWLEENGESLTTPRFDEHNGQSAKRRATETQRKRMARETGEMSAPNADKKRSREEKRREDTNTAPDGFESFWKTYPKKVGKPSAIKAFKRVQSSLNDILQNLEIMVVSEAWTKNAGQYVPNPATYLNDRRWEDGAAQKETLRFV
jgi:hypothetical protein